MLGRSDDSIPVMQTPEARRRSLVMPLVIATVVALVVVLATWRSGETQLTGAGSSLAQPLIDRAAINWRNSMNADNPTRPAATGSDWVVDGTEGVDYMPVGSVGGFERLRDVDVDFAVADYPLSAQELDHRGLIQVPVAAGGVAVAYNLGAPLPLVLDGPVLAGIMSGKVTRWNDPALAALNPGAALPDQPITAVHRTDGSGSTNALSRYLTQFSPDWAAGPGAGTNVAFQGGQGAEGTRGMLDIVKATPGAIGYVEAAQARRAGLQVAALRNAAGQATLPEPEALRAALSGLDWTDAAAAGGLAGSTSPAAYPMTTTIHAFLPREPRQKGDARRAVSFLGFLVANGSGAGDSLGYLPLPGDVAAQVETTLSTLYKSGS